MGLLSNDNSVITVDAVLTDLGRERLARNDGSFEITRYAFADDEIDYSLFSPNTGSLQQDTRILNTPIFEANVNATLSLRQPGSATKPITYSAALQKGYTASTVLVDVKTEFPGGDQPAYIPVNYDGQFRGPVQVRYALGNSYNIPAVKTLALTGVKNVMELGYRMGLSTWEPTTENINNAGLSLTLGGREVRLLDLTSAFGVLANSGVKQDPVSILKVSDAKDKTLYEYRQSDGTRIFEEGIAFIISNILSDNGARSAAFGTNSVLNISGKTVSVKTGTTDEKKDNWTIGYTPDFVVTVWVGNNDNTPMNQYLASGITGAAPIWNRVMSYLLTKYGAHWYEKPGNIAEKQCYFGKTEYFLKGTEAKANCTSSILGTVDVTPTKAP